MCRASHRFSHSVNKSFALDHFSNGLSRQGRKQLRGPYVIFWGCRDIIGLDLCYTHVGGCYVNASLRLVTDMLRISENFGI